jgi:hypothetical protein
LVPFSIRIDCCLEQPFLPAGGSQPFPDFPHDFVNSEGGQGGWFFPQLGTPSGQNSVLAPFHWLPIGFINDLLYLGFPVF